tara:strand:+ start:193 stop:1119 length:927 start_codon:yes stop_codon:yes gene_type:complete
MGQKTRSFLKNENRNFDNILDSVVLKNNNDIIFKYNYITCGYPITQNLGNSGDGVLATEDRFGMIFPGPNGEMYPAAACSIGAYTAAGKAPQVDGAVVATDAGDLAAGFDIQMDCESAAATGLELTPGGSPMGSFGNKFVVGTHSGYIDATFFTADWTDFDGVGIGFRKVEDFNDGHVPILDAGSAADGIYTDFAAYGVMTDTDVRTMTDLNNSGTSVVTDVTQVPVDADNMRLRITLAKDGAITYSFVNNAEAGAGTLAAPAAAVAFSFDSGDTVIPYIYTSADTAAADELFLKDVEISRAGEVEWV